MSIKNNIINFQRKLEGKSKLIAVSKTKSPELIREAFEAGQIHFGENKAQELAAKADILPDEIKWHMIGHLQRNKVKYIADFVHLIHSVDSDKLLKEINKRAGSANRTIECLFQVHIANEDSKFGWDANELLEYINSDKISSYSNVTVKGLMGMATFTDNQEQVQKEFGFLKKLFDKIKIMNTPQNLAMEELSIGMTGDYKIALKEGSTMVRIGTAIFGERIEIWKP